MVWTCHVQTYVSTPQHDPILLTKWPRAASSLLWAKNSHCQCQWQTGLWCRQEPDIYFFFPAIDCTTQATINASFVRECNYWLSYLNIKQACYNMLNEHVKDVFKFSLVPDLMGWNPPMEITKIMDQLTTTYGCPTPVMLLHNNTLLQSLYSPCKAPKVLFWCIEYCQEI